MKTFCSKQKNRAMTLVEVLVVIVVIAILAAMLLPAGHSPVKSKKIYCINNLKQVGLAYHIWAGDHDDKYPMEVSVTNGGTMELNNGRNAWINFLAMSNELSTPKILHCTSDAEHPLPATNFSSELSSHISYFVGFTSEANPQALLSGDDNFEISGLPVKPGWLELSTNAPISWTTARHNKSGNLALGDGSVQSTTSSGLRGFWQQTGFATNRIAIP